MPNIFLVQILNTGGVFGGQNGGSSASGSGGTADVLAQLQQVLFKPNNNSQPEEETLMHHETKDNSSSEETNQGEGLKEQLPDDLESKHVMAPEKEEDFVAELPETFALPESVGRANLEVEYDSDRSQKTSP